MAIGALASQMHWEEGSPEKVALHAAAAAIVAQLAGGNPGQAAAAAAVEELANGILQQVLKANPNQNSPPSPRPPARRSKARR
ncbi:hypothetical protein QD460_31090 [Rhizobium jaguaris]|uniref:Uncharacterized protein n=1 Tax=Rhizobium jaguaris TaxID=1312183 RepID=A0A387FT58_9HYPH|nr:hypothetical protein [Rhizobium jaguaris]AYG62440.1 hypothetical protein CCGE525_27060 [Rhizobium jaguaris]